MNLVTNFDKYIASPESELCKDLFSKNNISLTKDGPMSLEEVKKEFLRIASETQPLYVATPDNESFYLFY